VKAARTVRRGEVGKGLSFMIPSERILTGLRKQRHLASPLPYYLKDYVSPRDAREGLSAYLRFYNQERVHQALEYRTPAEVYFGK
jgi:transposase InsO family protein